MLLPFALAILSGLLYVFSFAPWDQGYLQWIAFVPLLIAVHLVQKTHRSWKTLFALGYIMSFILCTGGFYWIVYATKRYGGIPTWAALIVFGFFCIIGQLQIPIYLCLRAWAAKKVTRFWPLIAGLVYAGIESAYPKLFSDTAGNAFYRMVWTRQIVDLGGPFVLTALLISVNENFAQAFIRKAWRPAVVGLATVAILVGYGAYRTKEIQELTRDRDLTSKSVFNLTMIQANIGDYLKLEAEHGSVEAVDQLLQSYLSLSTQAAHQDPRPDMILWPETAYPALWGKPQAPVDFELERRTRAFANQFGGLFAFGGYDQDSSAIEYNSFFFFDPRLNQTQVYHKTHLLMFGETLPFANDLPSIKTWFPTMGFFGQGPGPILVNLKNAAGDLFKFAPSICYEGLFNDFNIDGAALGADALINVTNDSWFGPDGEPDLHLALTTYRSIETRLPFIRSTNTGYTVEVDPLGEIHRTTSLFNPETLSVSVRHRLNLESPYQKIAQHLGGHWFEHFCQLIVLALILLALIVRLKFA